MNRPGKCFRWLASSLRTLIVEIFSYVIVQMNSCLRVLCLGLGSAESLFLKFSILPVLLLRGCFQCIFILHQGNVGNNVSLPSTRKLKR